MPELELIWRAFELRPEPVPTLDPQGEYLRRAWAQAVYPLAEKLGMTMRLPPVQPRSRLAHEAAAWARHQGAFDLMNEAIFRAFFERGEDIGQLDVLVALAESVGLEGEALGRALEHHEYQSEVLADEQRAARYGLRGVPAFVAGGTVLFGVQSVDALEEFLRAAERATDAAPSSGPLPERPVKITR
ncbi:MAG: DsbA family oxidoreductase [Acidobacteria bacterium]|nr:MAG: DsbA family oxidoreductase [Acidobacteriota bacterium]